MAEALGLAASVIAVVDIATKIGSASFKLRKLCNEVREVPRMLLDKTEELHLFEDILRDTESRAGALPNPVWDSSVMQATIARARAALVELQDTVDRLSTEVNDTRRRVRRLASTKVVLRKDDIEALVEKLDRALMLFRMAQNHYIMVTVGSMQVAMQRVPDPVKFPASEVITASPSIDSTNQVVGKTGRRKAYSSNQAESAIFTCPRLSKALGNFGLALDSGGFQFAVRTPSWFAESVYSVLLQRSVLGWQLNLRAYELVEDWDDELEDVFKTDDVTAVQKYLHQAKMSPFTINYQGESLLDLAADCLANNTLKLLLEQGLDVYLFETSKDITWDIRLLLAWYIGPSIATFDATNWMPFLQLSEAHGYEEKLCDEVFLLRLALMTNFSNFKTVIERFAPQHLSLPLSSRLECANTLITGLDGCALDDLLFVLPELKSLDSTLLEISRDVCNGSLLHSFALGMAYKLYPAICTVSPKHFDSMKSSWINQLRTCIALDPEGIHHLDDADLIRTCHNACKRLESPLSAIITALFLLLPDYETGPHLATGAQALEPVVSVWLTALHSAGIDLLAYGGEERRLTETGDSHLRPRGTWIWPDRELRETYTARLHHAVVAYTESWPHYNKNGTPRLQFSLFGITYGPLPEHWRLWWRYEYESFAGEFWEMVESPTISIPGAWVDDCEPEEEIYRTWDCGLGIEKRTSVIWSEYREICPPI